MFSERYEDVGAQATWGDTLSGAVDAVKSVGEAVGTVKSFVFGAKEEPSRYMGRGGMPGFGSDQTYGGSNSGSNTGFQSSYNNASNNNGFQPRQPWEQKKRNDLDWDGGKKKSKKKKKKVRDLDDFFDSSSDSEEEQKKRKKKSKKKKQESDSEESEESEPKLQKRRRKKKKKRVESDEESEEEQKKSKKRRPKKSRKKVESSDSEDERQKRRKPKPKPKPTKSKKKPRPTKKQESSDSEEEEESESSDLDELLVTHAPEKRSKKKSKKIPAKSRKSAKRAKIIKKKLDVDDEDSDIDELFENDKKSKKKKSKRKSKKGSDSPVVKQEPEEVPDLLDLKALAKKSDPASILDDLDYKPTQAAPTDDIFSITKSNDNLLTSGMNRGLATLTQPMILTNQTQQPQIQQGLFTQLNPHAAAGGGYAPHMQMGHPQMMVVYPQQMGMQQGFYPHQMQMQPRPQMNASHQPNRSPFPALNQQSTGKKKTTRNLDFKSAMSAEKFTLGADPNSSPSPSLTTWI